MRLAVAAVLAMVLAACGTPGTSTVSPPPPSPATLNDLKPYYGSYSTAGGDTFVVARLGWFFDLETSAYRTIYVVELPDRFSIGCRFREPLPKCADLAFTPGTLTLRDAANKSTVGHRVGTTETEVTIPAAGAELAGTITQPQGTAPRGGIVVVHGAEPGQRYFYDIWVGVYTGLGLDVMTYDKRGIGSSTGSYPGEFPTEDALETYAGDASAALAFLSRWPRVDAARVGFHGGSQGGWTVPLAISRHGGAAFAVLVSAPATTVDQTDLWAGFSDGGAVMPAEPAGQMLEEVRANHGGYDPAPALRSLYIPALWMLGTNDRTVPTAVCVEILSGLNKPNFTVRLLPTGHGLLVNPTGLSADDDRSPGLAPDLAPEIRSWLRANMVT